MRPAIGVAAAALPLAGLLLFAVLAEELVEWRALVPLDRWVDEELNERATPWLTSVTNAVSWLGSPPVLLAVTAVTAVVLGIRGHPNRLARGRQPLHVAELTQRDQRGQLAHPVETHQRLAAGLAARQCAQLALQRGDLGVDRVDHRERDLDSFARVVGQLQAVEEHAAGAGAQLLRGPPTPC